MRLYEPFEHTADVGLRIYGKDLGELFKNGAYALFDLIVDRDTVNSTQKMNLKAQGKNEADLFFAWLDELLYLHNTKYFLCREVKEVRIKSGTVHAEILGEIADPKRHAIRTEVKAVTYHQFEVKQTQEGWEATVIFDV